MKKALYVILFCAVSAIASGSASAGMAMSYHGKLVPADGSAVNTKVPMMIEFRLYRNSEPGETRPLWGRTAPVRFNADGSFYVELSDSAGAATGNAVYGSLSDAIVAGGAADIWLSLRPNGYGELLPRKRLGSVHRAQRVSTASNAVRLTVPELDAETVMADSCVIGGSMSVTKSVISGGGTIRNVIDNPDKVSVGTSSGTVLITDSFDCWYNLEPSSAAGNIPFADVLLMYDALSGYGAFSIPVAANPSSSRLPERGSRVLSQQFLDHSYSPFKN